MYHKILVPLDGSQRAEIILLHVKTLAHKFASKVILLQVIEPMPVIGSPYEPMIYWPNEEVERLIAEAKAYLAGIQKTLCEQGIETCSYVESGPVVPSILEVAAREDIDLIALASHGRTGLARVFYGSIAAGILNQADRPLLMIRAQV